MAPGVGCALASPPKQRLSPILSVWPQQLPSDRWPRRMTRGAIKLLQASLRDKSLTVSQTAALILGSGQKKGDKFSKVVARLLGRLGYQQQLISQRYL